MNIKSFFSNIAIVAILMGVFLFVKCSGGGSGSCKPNPVEPEMVFVEGGTFTMGCTAEQEDCWDNGYPPHQVTLSNFSIGKYPVTQKEWVAVMCSNPSRFKGDNLPVENVSWNDAQEFISKLNEATGKKYRLPTEAEWEYAARGGNQSKGFKYSGSNILDDVAWYYENSGDKRLNDNNWDYDNFISNKNRNHPVGMKSPNELGIYDMSGNVCEWCSDWSGDYSSSAKTNPTGAATGSFRVLRGGTSGDTKWRVRLSFRAGHSPGKREDFIGFRLAISSN